MKMQKKVGGRGPVVWGGGGWSGRGGYPVGGVRVDVYKDL